MQIEPATIYAAFGVLGTVVFALWGVVIADHRNCQRMLRLLTEHTIAQQIDIRAFIDDRGRRNLPMMELQSEKTEFYQQHKDIVEAREGI